MRPVHPAAPAPCWGGIPRPRSQTPVKAAIHPKNYRPVCFFDTSADYRFIINSCVETRETIEIDGKTYPLFQLDISHRSHPFFTGKQKIMDTAGRVDRFRRKYGME